MLDDFGPLAAGSFNQLDLTQAQPSSLATLVFGLAQLDAPFKGGTMVPQPSVFIALATSASGSASLAFTLPPGVPGDTGLYFQTWIQDPGATYGLSASNGLQGVTP